MGSNDVIAFRGLALIGFICFFVQPGVDVVRLWTWVRSLFNNDDRLVFVGSLFVANNGIFVLFNLWFYFIYSIQLPFFERFKISKFVWPWRSPSEEERDEWKQLIRGALINVAINQLCIALPLSYFAYGTMQKLIPQSPLEIPPWHIRTLQVFGCILVEDTLFYWGHRALHHKSIYGLVHKQHHEFKVTIGLSSEYAHPLEFIFSNVIPFSAGPTILLLHPYVFVMWTIYRITETIEAHGGYEFPWSLWQFIPFKNNPAYHDYHHTHNVGNYGSQFRFWDHFMQSDKDYLEFQRAEALKAESKDK